MKVYIIISIICTTIFGASCNWYIFQKSKYSVTDRPEICNKFFDNSKKKFQPDVLDKYSIDEALTIQKCGLAYLPHYQFQLRIANHNEYPTPAIIRRLRSEEDEYYQYYLILDLVALTKSEKHMKQVLSDKYLILNETYKAISKMQDKEIKKLAKEEFIKIKEFVGDK